MTSLIGGTRKGTFSPLNPPKTSHMFVSWLLLNLQLYPKNYYAWIKYALILCFSRCSSLEWLALKLKNFLKIKAYRESIAPLYSAVNWKISYTYILSVISSQFFRNLHSIALVWSDLVSILNSHDSNSQTCHPGRRAIEWNFFAQW